jgi:hypothetical protein
MSGIASSAVGTAISIAALVVVLSWVLLIAVMFGTYAALVVARKARGSSPGVMTGSPGRGYAPRPAASIHRPRTGFLPAGLRALRQVDPNFDEQLLLDAAQTAMLLIFVANSTGDEQPISRVVTESYWHTPQARVMHTVARDRRSSAQFDAQNPDGSRMRQHMVVVDYQASASSLVSVRLGSQQEVCVRVAVGQLGAVVRPGAAAMAASASATSLTSGFASLGRAVAEQADQSPANVSWVGANGHYDLTFVRRAGVQTDPAAALASRTCTRCGATYRSELATACQHCGAARAKPWGQWQLASAVPAG